jgi:hypothetical protein
MSVSAGSDILIRSPALIISDPALAARTGRGVTRKDPSFTTH